MWAYTVVVRVVRRGCCGVVVDDFLVAHLECIFQLFRSLRVDVVLHLIQ